MSLYGKLSLLSFLLSSSVVWGERLHRADLSLLSIYNSNTDLPSDWPSMIPSKAPSVSFWPAQGVFVSSSVLPLILPTGLPTATPSIAPSFFLPSSAPSSSCHDVASYRSPLNNFQCSDHAGTDCFQWRFLGLDAEEVEGLVVNCPVTCNVDCGTLHSFEVHFQFRLLNVDNFLAPESTRIFQETSADYLTRFVRPKAMDNKFIVHGVELLSQRLPDDNDEVGRRRVRSRILQENLHLSVAFRGFAVGLDYTLVEALLQEGIESAGYAGALQLAGDSSLRRARISFKFDEEDPSQQATLNDIANSSASFTWVFLAIGIVAIMVLGCAVVQYLRLVHGKKRKPAPPHISDRNFPIEIDAVSPIASSPGQLSFDGVLHIMSSFSPKSLTDGDGGEAPHISPAASKAGTHTSNSTRDSSSGVESEHPLTGIIPQMLVYKGIDGDEDCSVVSHIKRIVPSRRLDASPGFLEALHHRHGDSMVDYSVYDGIFECCNNKDSDDGVDILLRCSSEESVLTWDENADPKEMNHNNDAKASMSLNPKQSRERVRSPLRNLLSCKPSSSDPSTVVCKHPLLAVPPFPEGCLEEFIASEAPCMPQHPKGNDSGSHGSLVQTIMNMSPRKLLKPPAGPVSLLASETKPLFSHRKRSKSTCSDSSGDVARYLDDSEQLVFQAPRKGKLGLVIQCIDQKGPVIAQVKDYSPLLGQVLCGDRIMEIDNKSTVGMNLHDVTGLLGGSNLSRWASVFRIVVRRPTSTVDKEELLRKLNETPESAALLLSRSAVPLIDARSRSPALPFSGKLTPPRHPLLRSSSDPQAIHR